MTHLAAMAVPQFSPGPVIGSGGYLGAAGRGLLEAHFASVGAYILTVSVILGGLAAVYRLRDGQILAWVLGKPTQGLGRGVLHVGAAYAQQLEPPPLATWTADERSRTADVAVRISGRPAEEEARKTPKTADGEAAEAAEEEERSRPRRKPPRGAAGLAVAHPQAATSRRRTAAKPRSKNSTSWTARPSRRLRVAQPSSCSLPSETFCFDEQEKEVRRKAKILEKTFLDFGFNIRVVEIQTGPVIAQFEVELEAGLRLSKITGLADDLAIALRVPSVRIVAPIPGKNTVGVEVPNNERQIVRLREVMEETNGKAQKMRIPDLPRQGRLGQPDGRRPDHAAAPADRRPHGHGQERVPELDHRLDGHDPPARRGAHADDRPEDGRAEPLQEPAAPDAPGGDRHAQGRGDPGLGRREDGGALSPAGPGGRAARQRLQPAWRRGADGADPPGKRRASGGRSPRTCPTSSWWPTSWPT